MIRFLSKLFVAARISARVKRRHNPSRATDVWFLWGFALFLCMKIVKPKRRKTVATPREAPKMARNKSDFVRFGAVLLFFETVVEVSLACEEMNFEPTSPVHSLPSGSVEIAEEPQLSTILSVPE
jgi:hypothetical protein